MADRGYGLGVDDEPISSMAGWARTLGIFALPVVAIAVLLTRAGWVETVAALAALAAGFLLAGLAVLFGCAALAVIWVRGYRGARPAAIGVLLGFGVLAAPATGVLLGSGFPALSDITTDPGDPPAFVFASADRRAGDNDVAYRGARASLAQLVAYPDVAPLRVAVPPNEAHALALDLVQARGWRILDAGKTGSAQRGRIEAVARGPVLALSDDIVIRIRQDGTGSRVDMRSASRFGDRDFGVNARRVQSFLADLAAATE